MAESSALDSFWTGATTIAALTPAGMIAGVTPAGAPEGWGRLDTLEAATGLDVSDRVDTSVSGGAVAMTIDTIETDPMAPVRRGAAAVNEGGTNLGKAAGFLPSWWKPWMSAACWVGGGVVVLAIAAGPYVAPFIGLARGGKK